MGTTIQIKRGLSTDLPASANPGELLYTTDTNKLYIGTGTGLRLLVSQIVVSPNPPTSPPPMEGDLWFDTILNYIKVCTSAGPPASWSTLEASSISGFATLLQSPTITGVVLPNATINGGTF